MEFKVKQNLHNCDSNGLWYVGRTVNVGSWDQEYIWDDLTVKSFCSDAGYYATKAEAERYLMAYRVKGMKFTVKKDKMDEEWYISDGNSNYLNKDLEIHKNTGWVWGMRLGEAPGYYRSEQNAKEHLAEFRRTHNMGRSNNIELNVRVNGVDTPLHEISEQTLLRIREASKPKPVPVFQVARFCGGGRLIFKVTKQIADYVGSYVSLDDKGYVCTFREDGRKIMLSGYKNIRELRLEDV